MIKVQELIGLKEFTMQGFSIRSMQSLRDKLGYLHGAVLLNRTYR